MSRFEEHWKDFEDNPVSHSVAHYLMAIASWEKNGTHPKPADLARQLGVSRSAVSLQQRSLLESRLVRVRPDRTLALTKRGVEVVASITSKRSIVHAFLHEVLGINNKSAMQDSCKIEHLLSEETATALVTMVQFLRSDHLDAKRFLKTFSAQKPRCHSPQGCGLCSTHCITDHHTLQ